MLVLTGTLLPGIGFVPLGLDGLQDDQGNGLIQSFTTKVAPSHSGLEVGRYVVLAAAFRSSTMGLPDPGSNRLFVGDRLPATVDFSDGWINAPRMATYNVSARSVTVPAVMGADLIHVQLRAAGGAWHVWAPQGATTAPITIPPPPVAGMDRVASATISVDAVDLNTGSTLDSIFDVNAGGPQGIDEATRGFSTGSVTYQ